MSKDNQETLTQHEIPMEEMESVTGGRTPNPAGGPTNPYNSEQTAGKKPAGVPANYVHCEYSGNRRTCYAGICMLFGTRDCIAGYYNPQSASRRRK